MEYPWENRINSRVWAKVQAALPEGLSLVGIAVAHHENNEAALVDIGYSGARDVLEADLRKDILGDAQRQYSEAVMALPF